MNNLKPWVPYFVRALPQIASFRASSQQQELDEEQPEDQIQDDSRQAKSVEEPFQHFVSVEVRPLLSRFLRIPVRKNDISVMIHEINHNSLNQYVRSMYQRSDFCQHSLNKTVMLLQKKNIRQLGYELLEMQEREMQHKQFYTLINDEEFHELVLQKNDFLVMENLRHYFTNIKQAVLEQILELIAVLCQQPHPLHVLTNIVENLNYILGFCSTVPEKQVQNILDCIGNLVESQYNYEDQRAFNRSLILNHATANGKYPQLKAMTRLVVKQEIAAVEGLESCLNLVYTMLFLEAADIPKGFRDLVFKSLTGFMRHMNQESLIAILGSFVIKRISVTQELMDAVMANKKMTTFALVDLYILMQSFKIGGLDSNQYIVGLYYAFWATQQAQKSYPDLKTILMVTKIQEQMQAYVVPSQVFAFDRKTAKIAITISESLSKFTMKGKMRDLLYLANVYNKALQRPSFLFGQLLYYKNELKVDATTVELFVEFVQIQNYRLEEKYFYFHQKRWVHFQEENSPLRSQYREVLSLISKTIIESEYKSDELILQLTDLHSKEGVTIEKVVSDYLMQYWLTKETLSVPAMMIVVRWLRRTMSVQTEQQASSLMMRMHQEFMLQSTTLAQLIEWQYHVCQIKVDDSTRERLMKAMREYFDKRVVTGVLHNTKFGVEYIKMGQVDQINLQSHYVSELENYDYLLPLMAQLGVKPSASVKASLTTQLTRICKTWNGELLLENLLTLDHNKFSLYDTVFLYCAENLTSLFNFENDRKLFYVKHTKEQFLMLLRAYINQFNTATSIDAVNLDHYQNSLRILTFFAHLLYKELTQQEIMTLFAMIGPLESNYYPPFVQAVRANLLPQGSQLITCAALMPSWLANTQITQSLRAHIKSTNQHHVDMILALQNHFLYSPTTTHILIEQNEQAALLKYLRVCGDLSDAHVRSYINGVQLSKEATPSELIDLACVHVTKELQNVVCAFFSQQVSVACTDGCSYLLKWDVSASISSETKHNLLMHLDDMAARLGTNQYVDKEKGPISYYQTFTSLQGFMYEPQWRVYPTDSTQGQQPHPLLYDFLRSTSIKTQDQQKVLILHYLHLLQTVWKEQPIIDTLILEQSEEVQKGIIQQQRQNEVYVSVLIAITLNIPIGSQQVRKYTYKNGQLCPQTRIIVDLAIYRQQADEKDRSIAILFAQKEDIIMDISDKQFFMMYHVYSTSRLSPMAFLKGYVLQQLGQWDEVYYLDMDNWLNVYASRDAQEKFVKKLLDE